MVEASLSITEEEWQTLRDNESLEMKVHKGRLRDFMLCLVNVLETDSEESQSPVKEKGMIALSMNYNPISASEDYRALSTPPRTQREHPKSYDTPANKRKFSETSLATRSTETTPTKLVQPEAKVQSLQNKFVDSIINHLWFGKVDEPWVKDVGCSLHILSSISFALCLQLERRIHRFNIHYSPPLLLLLTNSNTSVAKALFGYGRGSNY